MVLGDDTANLLIVTSIYNRSASISTWLINLGGPRRNPARRLGRVRTEPAFCFSITKDLDQHKEERSTPRAHIQQIVARWWWVDYVGLRQPQGLPTQVLQNCRSAERQRVLGRHSARVRWLHESEEPWEAKVDGANRLLFHWRNHHSAERLELDWL